MKDAGVKLGGKLTHQVIASISGKTLTAINRFVGVSFRIEKTLF